MKNSLEFSPVRNKVMWSYELPKISFLIRLCNLHEEAEKLFFDTFHFGPFS